MFDWLNKIFEFIWQFVPRLQLVPWQCKAIRMRTVLVRDLLRFKWRPESKIDVLDPGFHVYWPLVTDWQAWPIKEQTLPVVSIQFETSEPEGARPVTVSASAVLTYDVTDLRQLICENYDAEDGMTDTAQTTVMNVCSKLSYAELRKGAGRTLDTKLRNAAKDDLARYGINVIRFTLNSLSPCRVYRVVQSTRHEGELR